jgi:hypothetical protein
MADYGGMAGGFGNASSSQNHRGAHANPAHAPIDMRQCSNNQGRQLEMEDVMDERDMRGLEPMRSNTEGRKHELTHNERKAMDEAMWWAVSTAFPRTVTESAEKEEQIKMIVAAEFPMANAQIRARADGETVLYVGFSTSTEREKIEQYTLWLDDEGWECSMGREDSRLDNLVFVASESWRALQERQSCKIYGLPQMMSPDLLARSMRSLFPAAHAVPLHIRVIGRAVATLTSPNEAFIAMLTTMGFLRITNRQAYILPAFYEEQFRDEVHRGVIDWVPRTVSQLAIDDAIRGVNLGAVGWRTAGENLIQVFFRDPTNTWPEPKKITIAGMTGLIRSELQMRPNYGQCYRCGDMNKDGQHRCGFDGPRYKAAKPVPVAREEQDKGARINFREAYEARERELQEQRERGKPGNPAPHQQERRGGGRDEEMGGQTGLQHWENWPNRREEKPAARPPPQEDTVTNAELMMALQHFHKSQHQARIELAGKVAEVASKLRALETGLAESRALTERVGAFAQREVQILKQRHQCADHAIGQVHSKLGLKPGFSGGLDEGSGVHQQQQHDDAEAMQHSSPLRK